MEQEQKSYYSQIWVEPRETISRIVKGNPNKGLWILAWIYGFNGFLHILMRAQYGYRLGLLQILFFALIFAPLLGYVVFSVWSGVVLLTGKMFKGKGKFKEIRAAYSWSFFPYVINVGVWLILAALFGKEYFTDLANNKMIQLTQFQQGVLFVVFLIFLTTKVWSWVIYINALSEVQNYSVLKTIGNILVSGFIFVILAYLLLIFAAAGGQQAPAIILHGATL